jgi:hypothetical protein
MMMMMIVRMAMNRLTDNPVVFGANGLKNRNVLKNAVAASD